LFIDHVIDERTLAFIDQMIDQSGRIGRQLVPGSVDTRALRR
jgi:hypothetical protein